MKLAFAVLAALGLAAAASAQTLEAVKSATLGSSFQSALESAPAAPKVVPARVDSLPRRADVAEYALGGFTFETDARNALAAAQRNLAAVGLKVLRGEMLRQNGTFNYGFRLHYFEANDPTRAPRAILSEQYGEYVWESDANNAKAAAEASLRARGYAVVIAETLKRAAWPNRYYYRLAYSAAGAPAAGLYTSGAYASRVQAQEAQAASISDFSRKGWLVEDSRLFHDPRTGLLFFQINYRRR